MRFRTIDGLPLRRNSKFVSVREFTDPENMESGNETLYDDDGGDQEGVGMQPYVDND